MQFSFVDLHVYLIGEVALKPFMHVAQNITYIYVSGSVNQVTDHDARCTKAQLKPVLFMSIISINIYV